MSEFSVSTLNQSAIQYLYSMRSQIWLDPPYQRLSDIWSLDKRQLLVDSVINGFDIPKLYFHELVPPRKIRNRYQKYAIIDGKQRLDALWGFMDGKFALAHDFEYLLDSGVSLAGMTYADISQKHQLVKSRFDGTSLAVVAVRTDDIELIEDMFSRLNEAVPLNAPEKRNAFGGPLPKAIRQLANHEFFRKKIPFSDRRYRHRDLAAKFLMIESKDGIADTKKVYLDEFVRKWARESRSEREANKLRTDVEAHLDRLTDVFIDRDHLLKSIGMVLVVFHFFRFASKKKRIPRIRREMFERFEAARRDNRAKAENNMAEASYDLLEFDKYVQTPNDAYATRLRLAILVDFMRKHAKLGLPEADEYSKIVS